MTRRRFYAPPNSFASDEKSVTLGEDETRHLRDVLRLADGDEVYVFNGVGREFQCTVARVERDSVQLSIIEEVAPARPESPLTLTLAVALLKGEKFDLVLQKVTELGVSSIQPVITSLADVRLNNEPDINRKLVRWKRIVMEAAKQCGRAVIPEVGGPRDFAHVIRSEERPALMFSERDGRSLLEVTKGLPSELSSMVALVGSEGGWTDNEIALAHEADWLVVTLGGRILRAETAAIAVAAILQNRFGDLQ
ncbi:MAG TPA: 16S rRNA (uracil(1498)-N(3))-methyltransferase [Pyrinomonadaceae bacterium]|nr:16S rRNA (uracil(1498)-N(3))-methyltransferase [Pyrinomonadaceae bacterium]